MAVSLSEDSCLVPGKHFVDGVCLPGFTSVEHLKELKKLSLDPSDILVTGYPRSGNTWTFTTVDAILKADDLEAFEKNGSRTITLDIDAFFSDAKERQSHGVLMSHLRYHMLPEDIKRKNIKMIHISRDPRDVAVSYYHFCQIMKSVNYKGTWDTFFKAFMEGNVMIGSWFEYTKDWIKYKDDPNILFIDYEGFIDDNIGTINKIASFVGRKLSPSTVERIASIVSFRSMQNDPNFNRMEPSFLDGSKGHFIRSGKRGDWKKYFTSEQEQAFDSVYQIFFS